MTWKRVSVVLCDRMVQKWTKWKVSKSVVRPATIYGSATWPMKKTLEKKMDAEAVMRMLRWMMGKRSKDGEMMQPGPGR